MGVQARRWGRRGGFGTVKVEDDLGTDEGVGPSVGRSPGGEGPADEVFSDTRCLVLPGNPNGP